MSAGALEQDDLPPDYILAASFDHWEGTSETNTHLPSASRAVSTRPFAKTTGSSFCENYWIAPGSRIGVKVLCPSQPKMSSVPTDVARPTRADASTIFGPTAPSHPKFTFGITDSQSPLFRSSQTSPEASPVPSHTTVNFSGTFRSSVPSGARGIPGISPPNQRWAVPHSGRYVPKMAP